MKSNPYFGIIAVTMLLTVTGISRAQTIATVGVLTNQSTMPGSDVDYSFYGNPAPFPGDNYYVHGTDGGGSQPEILQDFTENQGDFQYINGGQAGNFSVVNNPDGAPVQTGILFGGNPNVDGHNADTNAVSYTLKDAGSGFNLSNFNVYVLFSNASNGGYGDSALTLTLVTPSGSQTQTQAVSGSYSDTSASFAEFNITGAVAGDTLQLGYIGAGSAYGDLGGVSFESNAAPEPSTWAMMITGLGLLAFGLRLSRNRAALKL